MSEASINKKTKFFYWISIVILIVGIASWLPYLVFNIQVGTGILTLILSPIGFYFGYLAENRSVALANLLMIFSFIPVVIYIYFSKGYIPM
ncbi:hypothetical protein D5F11_011345 [Siminovitchia terrae]|uniref:Uncharacterized protein n=1 Tax=Siminovitchia terrae TaxID=1914933 RepID=A0A429X8Q7_SIMTE|nr:hypothetical protein D5F11_011345 [Siminovitchia terrae]